MIMEIEYDPELDEYFIVIPDSMAQRLEWEEGDMLEYELDDEVLRIFKI
jgi:bifunctional DNA-binding transcriptional regulator/antitoxin component of YhaV-PrlF toxin-antitoxin module